MNHILLNQLAVFAGVQGTREVTEPTNFIVEVVTRTPVWVWPLFLLLIAIGYSRTKQREVAAPRLLILPIALFMTTSASLFVTGVSPANVFALFAGLALGSMFGSKVGRRDGAVMQSNNIVQLRGEWTTMMIIMSVFALRFSTGVIGGVAPKVAQSAGFEFAILLIGGALAGVTIGRALTHTGKWPVPQTING